MNKRRFVDARLDAIRHTPHICLAEGLRSAARAINRRYARCLAGTGVGPVHLSVLMRLYYLGPTPMARLAYEMETDRTTFTRNVKVMVDLGIVEITSVDDKRSKVVGMTNKGFAALIKAVPKWEQAQVELREQLGEPHWSNILAGTRKMVMAEGLACSRTSRPTKSELSLTQHSSRAKFSLSQNRRKSAMQRSNKT